MNLIQLYKNSFSGLSKDVWIISLIYLVNRCGEMVIPFMAVYLTQQLGFTKTESGIVLFCFGLGALMGASTGGHLTDRIGNFKVMVLSLAGNGIAFCGILLFTSFLPLCLWMIVTGLFSAMFSPAAFSAVSMWGKKENQTRGYSLLRMAINLGASIGPAIGGFLAFKVGYDLLFIVDGLTCFFAVAAVYVYLKHRNVKHVKIVPQKDVKEVSPYKDVMLLLFLFFNLLNMVAFFQILFAVPVYFKEVFELDEHMIGFFFTGASLIILILEMPLVYLIEKSGKYFKPMILGTFLIALAYLSLGLVGNPFTAIVLYCIFIALGEIINFPLIPTLAMHRADEANQGQYMGVVSMMFAMAFLLAPISGLPVVELIGFHKYWFVAAGLSILSGISMWIMMPYYKPKSKAVTEIEKLT